MADEKVYTPEVVPDASFPNEVEVPVVSTGQTSPVGTYSPTVTKASPFPVKRIAHELIGTALNTRSKKILQEFELVQSGGLKIGDYQSGETGDLRLTPNGLTARDKAGLTTFAIDGTTGDAVFKGTVQADSVIATTIYANNISDDLTYIKQVEKSADQSITGDAEFQTVSDLTMSFYSEKTARIMLFLTIYAGLGGTAASPRIRIRLVQEENTTYLPSFYGWVMPAAGASDIPHDRLASFTTISNINSGLVQIYVDAARTTNETTLSILGLQEDFRSTLSILTVGSAITE
jgi:hypothetical protein